jgi:hypothetical protein
VSSSEPAVTARDLNNPSHSFYQITCLLFRKHALTARFFLCAARQRCMGNFWQSARSFLILM